MRRGVRPGLRPATDVEGRPRVGFLGVGWIGRNRLASLAASGLVEVVGVADPDAGARAAAAELAPGAEPLASYDELLELALDGLVIATPSAAHAEQARAALERGLAVFCQKPLARTAAEARAVVEAARSADRLLGVDFCYRRTAAMEAIHQLVGSGELGRVYAADLTFHNAYGPDGAWFYERAAAGGGCMMDLGIHLVDLALWTLGFPEVLSIESRLYHQGGRLGPSADGVEDYAVATLGLEGDVTVRIASSWNLHAGRDAVIEATFHGTRGAGAMRNVDGSFYDFAADHLRGTVSERLVDPPDDWGGRTIAAWADRLGRDLGFDPAVEKAVSVAAVLDRIYERAGAGLEAS